MRNIVCYNVYYRPWLGRLPGSESSPGWKGVGGDHSSNATCLTHDFFKSGEFAVANYDAPWHDEEQNKWGRIRRAALVPPKKDHASAPLILEARRPFGSVCVRNGVTRAVARMTLFVDATRNGSWHRWLRLQIDLHPCHGYRRLCSLRALWHPWVSECHVIVTRLWHMSQTHARHRAVAGCPALASGLDHMDLASMIGWTLDMAQCFFRGPQSCLARPRPDPARRAAINGYSGDVHTARFEFGAKVVTQVLF